jgi:hypothetical protein
MTDDGVDRTKDGGVFELVCNYKSSVCVIPDLVLPLNRSTLAVLLTRSKLTQWLCTRLNYRPDVQEPILRTV